MGDPDPAQARKLFTEFSDILAELQRVEMAVAKKTDNKDGRKEGTSAP